MSWRTQGFADRDAIARIPSWLNPLAQALPSVQSSDVTRLVPIDGSGRHAAVLVLFGDGPDVLLIERARGADAHSGQPAFPGGVAEPVDVEQVPGEGGGESARLGRQFRRRPEATASLRAAEAALWAA